LVPPGLVNRGNVGNEVHTLRHPILSQHAARAFYSGGAVQVPVLAGGPDVDATRPRSLLAQYLGSGPVREDVAAAVSQHVSPLQEVGPCAPWLARWRVDHPDSSEARAFDPRSLEGLANAESLNPPTLAHIEQLFQGVLPPPRPDGNTVARAANVTNLF